MPAKSILTVKAGLIDMRDELPLVMIVPTIEIVRGYYSGNLFDIERSFSMSIVHTAYKIEELREGLKVKLEQLKQLFGPETLGWQLPDVNGDTQVCTYEIGKETFGTPTSEQNSYTQFCNIQLNLRSYYKITNPVIPIDSLEYTPTELLDYVYTQTKADIPNFIEYWRDVSKPVNLTRFPSLGVFLGDADDDKDSTTSLGRNQLSVAMRVYSSLATKEVAFTNHLKQVELVRAWILQRPSLNGSVDRFNLTSIDYGIDTFNKPFQGGMDEIPVFRSDITVDCALLNFY